MYSCLHKTTIVKSESKPDQLQSSFGFVVSTGPYELLALNRWLTSVGGTKSPYILMLRGRNRTPSIFLSLFAKRNFPRRSIHPFAPYCAIRSPPTKHGYGRLSSQFGTVFPFPSIAGVVRRVRIRSVTTFRFSSVESCESIARKGP